MLNDNVDFDDRQVMHQEIITSNTLMLGALAWKGYQLKSRGAVVVYGLKQRQASLTPSSDAEINYFSQEETVQSYPEAIGLFQLLDEYEPNNEMVVAFICSDKSFIDSYCIALDFPLVKCFILSQERLLSA
jgi:hypothetical protein